jgi:hypothetical protein
MAKFGHALRDCHPTNRHESGTFCPEKGRKAPFVAKIGYGGCQR